MSLTLTESARLSFSEQFRQKNQHSSMKKLIDKIRTKDREEKSKDLAKKSLKAAKNPSTDAHPGFSEPPVQDLFWDDYSDVGYC